VALTDRKRPWLAVLLAFLYPGLGHVYLREWIRAIVWFGLVVTSSALLIPEDTLPQSLSPDAFLAAAEAMPLQATLVLFSVTVFSMIDAYWMAKQRNHTVTVAEGTTCPNCGKEIDSDIDFCHWCTEPLAQDADRASDDGA